MNKIWLFDLDGTLALMDGRGPFEWSRAGEDLPNAPVITVAKALIGYRAIVGYISGRKEQCRRQTEMWLLSQLLIPHVEHLWMRGDQDDRPDEIVKRELYENEIAPYFEIEGIFDDRNKVVAMWRSLGLPCFQVAEGNF
jgi:hypothetical protein